LKPAAKVLTNRLRKRNLPLALILLLTLSVVLTATNLNGGQDSKALLASENAESLSTIDALEVMQSAYREVARKVLPVVVEIDVTDVVKRKVPEYQSPFEFFFGPQNPQEGRPQREREFKLFGLGSGVIVKRSGQTVYVLTNDHVVGKADEIKVTLQDKREFSATLVGKDPRKDKREFSATLVGKDPRKDLALVAFETEEDVPIAMLGNSDTVQVGDIVFAVGNPFGFESTITSGIVSAVGRRPVTGTGVAGFTDYIQTDAAINQGNSGGALVNIRGEVIGINTWITSPSGGSVGLGFTIPINNARQSIDDFITKGSVEYGWLGINISDATDELKKDMGLGNRKGAFVFDLFTDSPADKAGILPGDFITDINGAAVADAGSLLLMVGNLPIGETARFDLLRYGQSRSVSVRITARKDEEAIREQRKNLWPGMAVMRITPEIQEQLELPKRMGELVIGNVSSDGPAGLAGIRPGDVIKSINGKTVSSIMEFYRALNETSVDELMLRIYRQGNELLIGLIRKK
jgi:serine protease Do